MNLTIKTVLLALLLSGCAEAADDRDDAADESSSPGASPESGKTNDAATPRNDVDDDVSNGGEEGTVGRRDAGTDGASDASTPRQPADAATNRPDSTVIGPKDDGFSFPGFPGTPGTGFPGYKPVLIGTGTTTVGAGASIKYDAQAYDAQLSNVAGGCVLVIEELSIHNTISGAGDVYLGDVLVASGGKCVVDSVPAAP